MRGIAIISDSLISPLGMTSDENFDALKKGTTGVSRVEDRLLCDEAIVAAKINALPFLD